MPPLPPAAPPARPTSLTCCARHGALSGAGSPPWRCVCAHVCPCACVRTRACLSTLARATGDPGQCPSFVSGGAAADSHPHPYPHLPPSCCPRGRPRGEATYIYSPSVPPQAASFRAPPASRPRPRPVPGLLFRDPLRPGASGAGSQTGCGLRGRRWPLPRAGAGCTAPFLDWPRGGSPFPCMERAWDPPFKRAPRAGCGLAGGGWRRARVFVS